MRDKELIECVRIDPRTTNQIDDLGICPSYAMLTRRLRRLRRRGLIRHQGTVQLKGAGRPVDYYCSWPVKRDAIVHELEITDVRDLLLGEWKRGRALSAEVTAEKKHRDEQSKKTDPDAKPVKPIWPDAVLVRGGCKYYLEYDTTEQTMRQIAEKFEGYAGFRHKLLFVTRGGMDRLRHVVQEARPVETFALFTTYDLLDSDEEAVWYGAALAKAIKLPQ